MIDSKRTANDLIGTAGEQRILGKSMQTGKNNSGNISMDQYFSLLAKLDLNLNLLVSKNRDSLISALSYFRVLFKFTEIPKKLLDSVFIFTLMNEVQLFPHDDILETFGTVISLYYDNEILAPPPELVDYVLNLLFHISFPFNSQEVLLISLPLLKFLGSIVSNSQDSSFIGNDAFYEHLIHFVGISDEFNVVISYFLTKILNDEFMTPENVLLLLPHFFNAFFRCPISPEFTLNFTSCILMYIEKSQANHTDDRLFLSNASTFLPQLSPFWGISSDINFNLLLICSLDQIPIEILGKSLLENGGFRVVYESIMMDNHCGCASAAFDVLTRILEPSVDFRSVLSFLVKNDDEYLQLQVRSMYYCNEGTIPERISAGSFYARLIRLNPDIVYQTFFEVGRDYQPELVTPVSILADLLFFEDNDLSLKIIQALFAVYKLFEDRGTVHEFREACAAYNLMEKINYLTEKKNCSEILYDVGNDFVLVAFDGNLAYDDAYMC